MTTAALSPSNPNKALHYSLWAVQVLLGLAFLMAGQMKLFTAIPQLSTMLPWVASTPEALVRFIGLSELLGGLGLILPAATRIKPQLTALAAAGLVLVMVLASGFHVSRGELGALPVNFVLGGLAAFVAWGRFNSRPSLHAVNQRSLS
jgi:putative oxidoreductase